MKPMKLKALADSVGVSPQTIRRLEKARAIPEAKRDRNGHRVYRREHVEEIARVIWPQGISDVGGRS